MYLFPQKNVSSIGIENIFYLPSGLAVPNTLLWDEWIDGWLERWKDEWMNKLVSVYFMTKVWILKKKNYWHIVRYNGGKISLESPVSRMFSLIHELEKCKNEYLPLRRGSFPRKVVLTEENYKFTTVLV